MYIRELYLRRIRPFYRNEQIKILTGVRRAGKTELLKMIQAELLNESDSAHIVYLSFELLENSMYRDTLTLYEYLNGRISDSGIYYIFLDEVQFVNDWPELVNSLKAKYSNASIFITGSNSDLLAADKARVLVGRTISFRVMPFTFYEYYSCRSENSRGVQLNADEEFSNYMRWGGFPLIFNETEDSNRQVMLESIFDSIVLRDIASRLKLKNYLHFQRVLDYVISSTGNYISGRNIAERFAGEKKEAGTLPKILDYLEGIEQSCIVNIVPRFDIIGLKTLEFNNKTYTCDPALINYKKSLISDLYGSMFETIVYNELIARGYTVQTGTVYGKEIDFVATRSQSDKMYIQVAYEITEHNRRKEIGNFDAIKDNYPKIVLSRDKVTLSERGIIHRNIVDFLLDNPC